MSDNKDAMTPDEAFLSIPPECKTGRYRADGPARIVRGVTPAPHDGPRGARRYRHGPLLRWADIAVGVSVLFIVGTMILLFGAVFGWW